MDSLDRGTRGGEYGGGDSYASDVSGDQPHLSRHWRTRSYDRASSVVSVFPSPITSRANFKADLNPGPFADGGLGADCGGESDANGSVSGPGIAIPTRCDRGSADRKSFERYIS